MDQDATSQGSRPQPKRHCVRWGPSSPLRKGAEPPNFRPVSIVAKRLDGSRCHLVGRQASAKATLCYWGPSSPSPKREQSPNYRPCLLWPDCWMDQDATWHEGRSLPKPHCARWGPALPPPKVHSPQFSAHICCGQMAGWINMPLGREIGLSPGDPAPLPQKGRSPNFRPLSIVAKRLDGSRWHLVRR